MSRKILGLERSNWQSLWTYLKPYRLWFILFIGLSVPVGLTEAAMAVVFKPLFDSLQTGFVSSAFHYAGLMMFGLALLGGVLGYCSLLLGQWLALRVTDDFKAKLFSKLMSHDVAYIQQSNTGQIVQQYYRETENLNYQFFYAFREFIIRVFSIISLVVTACYLAPGLAFIAATAVILLPIPVILSRQYLGRLQEEVNQVNAKLIAMYAEAKWGIRLIYVNNLATSMKTRFYELQQSLFKKQFRQNQINCGLMSLSQVLSALGVASLIFYCGSYLPVHQFSQGTVVTLLIVVTMLYKQILGFGNSTTALNNAAHAGFRILTTLNNRPKIVDKSGCQELVLSKAPSIEFQDIEFYYEQQSEPLFSGLNLQIQPGEQIAIIGPSGSGKSTLVNLIPRFFDVNSGAVLIDGVDIRDVSLTSLRSNISMVMQENFLFEGSIRDNLTAGLCEVADDQIEDVLKKAGLFEFIRSLSPKNSLEDGLSRTIGEYGVSLSEGEKQRVAIARALLKNSKILILDEMTHSLDNLSEARIREAMHYLAKGKTVIIIAHRLSTIQHVDRVVLMEQGQVVDCGTHAELLERCSLYKALYEIQFQSEGVVS